MNVNPLAMAIPQVASNTQIFTGQRITDTPDLKDQALRDYFTWLISQFGGGAGRAFNQAGTDAARAQAAVVKESEGQVAPPPIPRVAGPVSAFVPATAQSLTLQSASGVFQERARLEQQKALVTQQSGVPLPNATELGRSRLGSSFLAGIEADSQRPAQELPAGRPTFLSGGPSIETGSAPALIINAVRLAGVGRDWEPYLDLLAQRASGSNPAAPGGLFSLDPRSVPRGTNIQDPIQNTLAAIRLIQQRWGHPSQIPGLVGQ